MVPLLWVSLPSIEREREYWSIQLRGRFMNLASSSDFRLSTSTLASRGQTDRRSVTVHERSGRWKSNIWRGLLQSQCTNYRHLSHHLRAGSGSRTRLKIFFCPFFSLRHSALRHGDGCINNHTHTRTTSTSWPWYPQYLLDQHGKDCGLVHLPSIVGGTSVQLLRRGKWWQERNFSNISIGVVPFVR